MPDSDSAVQFEFSRLPGCGLDEPDSDSAGQRGQRISQRPAALLRLEDGDREDKSHTKFGLNWSLATSKNQIAPTASKNQEFYRVGQKSRRIWFTVVNCACVKQAGKLQ